jgi:NAD(P) transhydrogenase
VPRPRSGETLEAVSESSEDERFDLVVIGAGPAGEKGAAQAAYFGKRVAIVEREADPGGAAVHTGTLPSKTLRETALFLSGYRQLDLYGVTVEVEPHLAVAKLIARKDAVRRSETDRMIRNLDAHGIERIHGEARFVDRETIEVTGGANLRRLSAEVVLIATGSHPFRPPSIPFDDPDVHDSNDILAIERLPSSLAVLGGGVIGCEYASMFAALGVQVHLVEGRGSLLPFLDREIGERLLAGMVNLGVIPHLDERAEEVGRDANGRLTCRLTSGALIACDQVLVTSGRSGNTAGLDLEAVGVGANARGYVVVDEGFRTAVPGIYAAGDVIGFPALASTSMEQARVAVCRAFGFDYKQEVSSLLPYGVYTIPEVSCVGLGEQDAEERGIDAAVGRAFFRDNARGQILGDRDGMIKLVFDRESRGLVGCHCIGERASELVHVGEIAIALGGTVDTFIEIVFNYPTLGEAFKYAAYDALGSMGPAA